MIKLYAGVVVHLIFNSFKFNIVGCDFLSSSIKDFVIRLVSVFLAIPSMLLINLFIEYISEGLTPYVGEEVDYSGSIFAQLLGTAMYAFPVYLIVGIPVSYLVDYISSQLNKKFLSLNYLLELCLYGLVCLVMISLFIGYQNLFTLLPVELIIIPVLTYFHILYFIRKRL